MNMNKETFMNNSCWEDAFQAAATRNQNEQRKPHKLGRLPAVDKSTRPTFVPGGRWSGRVMRSGLYRG